jgi:hypothetical protein
MLPPVTRNHITKVVFRCTNRSRRHGASGPPATAEQWCASTMEELFSIEFHPVGGPPRRTRYLSANGDDDLVRAVEERRDDAWVVVAEETVDYFAYSDEP